jgi:hypothetical protein
VRIPHDPRDQKPRSTLPYIAALALALGCGPASGPDHEADTFDEGDTDASSEDVGGPDSNSGDTGDASTLDGDIRDDDAEESAPFVLVTFNTGSGANPPSEGNGGFGPEQSDISDDWFGNGLAWKTIVDDTTEFFAVLDADIVTFQEIFWPGECEEIPEELHAGFVCEDDPAPDDTVAEQVLGPEYQVACHPGSPDKCIAVKRSFGHIEGCDGDLCLDGLRGTAVEGCGRGARLAAGTIVRADGGPPINVVNVHGTSGFEPTDQDCRVREVDRIFLGTETLDPLANGAVNLIVGDFNTDPGRGLDVSAARWLDYVGGDHPFQFLTDVGQDAQPTYILVNIDHAVSDTFEGDCVHAGITEGTERVTPFVHFDHAPVICTLR